MLNEVVEAADDSETSAVIPADDWASALKWKWAWRGKTAPLSIALGKNGLITMAKGEQSLRTLEAACRHKAVFVVYDITRFAREARLGLEMWDRLIKAKAHLAAVAEGINTLSPLGKHITKLIFTILSGVAEMQLGIRHPRFESERGLFAIFPRDTPVFAGDLVVALEPPFKSYSPVHWR